MPLGSVGYENAVDEKGERLVWLDRAVVDRLGAAGSGRRAGRPTRGIGDPRTTAPLARWRLLTLPSRLSGRGP